MKILVTFAVDAEFAPWRNLRQFSVSNNGIVSTYTARAGENELVVILTGVGKKAWAEGTKVIWDGNVDVCISSGLAGALRAEHRPSDILAPKEVRAKGWNKVIPCDPRLLELASSCGAKIVRAFHSVDRVIVRSEEKRQLGEGADAVEMESGDILLEAIAFGAKVVAIRGISDTVEEDLPLDFNRAITSAGDLSTARVLLQAAKHPGSVPALIRFGHQSHRAAQKLADFMESYVQKLPQLLASRRSKEVSAT